MARVHSFLAQMISTEKCVRQLALGRGHDDGAIYPHLMTLTPCTRFTPIGDSAIKVRVKEPARVQIPHTLYLFFPISSWF